MTYKNYHQIVNLFSDIHTAIVQNYLFHLLTPETNYFSNTDFAKPCARSIHVTLQYAYNSGTS